jgi:UDP-N-acetylglucosamine 2-epimerase (non-hydrolysing)
MKKFEKRCIETKPTLVVVVGDVNSTLASSIVAKKLGIEVAHIEAGLRSGDMSMPEEINRIVTDSISDFLFVTEKSAINNLEKEGKSKDRIFFVGNTMIDSLVVALKKLDNINIKEFRASSLKKELGTYGVVTLHRPSNVDDRVQLLKIINILNKVSHRIPLIFPMHPRTAKKIRDFSIRCSSNIYVEKPLGYLEFIFLCKNAKFVLTDSGGIQEETTFLKVPCFTLRKNTERPVTVEIGTNVLLGEDVNRLPLLINRILGKDCKHSDIPPFWDGRAAERIVQVIKKIKNAD